MCTASYSYRFKILATSFLHKRFIWALWRISSHTNLQICTFNLIILSMGMACSHPLAHRFVPKTRSSLLTVLLNIASQSSHHQYLQLPQEKHKSPTKGRDGVSTAKKFYCSFGLTILNKWTAKIATNPGRKSPRH